MLVQVVENVLPDFSWKEDQLILDTEKTFFTDSNLQYFLFCVFAVLGTAPWELKSL